MSWYRSRSKGIRAGRIWPIGLLVPMLTAAALIGFTQPDRAEPPHPSIDLGLYRLTFDESFDTLDVSARGPGSRWIAHTPWGGDFGDARFVDPRPGFPFTVDNGILRIEARRNENGQWESGLLASVDPDGTGFSQQYGYFEMRAKLPAGLGLWPAFWLDSFIPKDVPDPSIEIDVIEHYSQFPKAYESIVTVWPKDPKVTKTSVRKVHTVPEGILSAGFHTYGVSVDPEWTVFYFDRAEIWRVKTPTEHKHKLMILVNLAMGAGWPITDTPNPSYMYVDYVRAFEKIAP